VTAVARVATWRNFMVKVNERLSSEWMYGKQSERLSWVLLLDDDDVGRSQFILYLLQAMLMRSSTNP
jgi:hypothetical protein